ncbi:MAG: polysaccharide biosynthesis/export family protein [Terriglobia bacterium]
MIGKKVVLKAVVALALAAWMISAARSQAAQSTAAGSSSAATAVNSAASSTAPQLERRNPRYQVSDGDILDLSFPYTPEFNQELTIQPDGFISVRGVGDMHVDGETVPEIEAALRQGYSKIMRNPVVTVTLKQFNMPYFVASGQVAKPGKYDLRGETTLTEALAIAGGLRDDAKPSHVYLFHRVSKQWVEVKNIDVKKMLHSGNLQEDLDIRTGDLIWVPKSGFAKVSRFIPYSSMGFYYGGQIP